MLPPSLAGSCLSTLLAPSCLQRLAGALAPTHRWAGTQRQGAGAAAHGAPARPLPLHWHTRGSHTWWACAGYGHVLDMRMCSRCEVPADAKGSGQRCACKAAAAALQPWRIAASGSCGVRSRRHAATAMGLCTTCSRRRLPQRSAPGAQQRRRPPEVGTAAGRRMRAGTCVRIKRAVRRWRAHARTGRGAAAAR